ncbi:MAG: MFS transporter [Calditrichaceae bacterium]
MKIDSRMTAIFVVAFLNLIGFGVIIPLLPYYAETFGAHPTQVGFLVASYAGAQLIGAPLIGRFSDKFGRRPALMYSIAGSVLGYIIFANASSLSLLFFSRIVSGFMSGNISVAQAYIADITDEKDRAKGLGLIAAAFGLGFITGPALGGALSVWGYGAPAYAAGVLNLASLFAVYHWLPETLTVEDRENHSANQKPPISFSALSDALTRPLVGTLLQTRFLFSLSFAMFTTVFALFAQYRLSLNAQSTGYILAYVGLLIVIVQAFAIGALTSRITEGRLLFSSMVLMGFSLLFWAFTYTVPVLLIVLIPLALSSGVFNTVINSSLSIAVSKKEIGGILGISASLDSLTRVIAPSAGGYVLEQYGASAPGIVSALLLILLIPLAWKRFISSPHPALNSSQKTRNNQGR